MASSLRDQPFFHHLDGNANRGAAGALAVARLQHVQAAVLDGELEVLHVAIVLFQTRGDFAQLVVDVGLDLLELGDVHRRANAGDHVFALRVHQELAVKLFHAGRGIAREADAGAAGLAQVAEDHGLHVDRGAQHVVDVVDAAIVSWRDRSARSGTRHRAPSPAARAGPAETRAWCASARPSCTRRSLPAAPWRRDRCRAWPSSASSCRRRLLQRRAWECRAPRCRTSESGGDRSRRRSADCCCAWPGLRPTCRSGRG